MVSETISENNQRKETCLISDFEGDETEMTIEHIHKHCCVCGFLLPDNLTGYELVLKGAGRDLGNGHLIYFCKHHTEEQINDSQQGSPRFYRASELMK